ncbi:MAG: hypothetical protein BGO99_07470 [Nitrosospira sp. 56-18]|nr:MAG: hypothetical protein BGO99_07470 [Nitrosospira sp. 56-18]
MHLAAVHHYGLQPLWTASRMERAAYDASMVGHRLWNQTREKKANYPASRCFGPLAWQWAHHRETRWKAIG